MTPTITESETHPRHSKTREPVYHNLNYAPTTSEFALFWKRRTARSISMLDRLEGSMWECELCGRRPAELARTGRRIWLGCPRCQRTWNVAAKDYHVATDDVAAQRAYESQ